MQKHPRISMGEVLHFYPQVPVDCGNLSVDNSDAKKLSTIAPYLSTHGCGQKNPHISGTITVFHSFLCSTTITKYTILFYIEYILNLADCIKHQTTKNPEKQNMNLFITIH